MTFAARPAIVPAWARAKTAKYWRIYITAANSQGWGSVSELEFMDMNAVRCQVAGGVAIASSYLNSDYAPAYAFDGVNNDIPVQGGRVWAPSSASPPAWLGYQHAAPVTVAGVRVTARLQTWAEQAPRDFRLEFSHDGATWTEYFSVANQTNWGGYESRTFTP